VYADPADIVLAHLDLAGVDGCPDTETFLAERRDQAERASQRAFGP